MNLFAVPFAHKSEDSIPYIENVVDVRWVGYHVPIACFIMLTSNIKHAWSTGTPHDVSLKHPAMLKKESLALISTKSQLL